MNKKEYIKPGIIVTELELLEDLLLTMSATDVGLRNGGKTETGGIYNVTSSDTKESGNWSNIWDE